MRRSRAVLVALTVVFVGLFPAVAVAQSAPRATLSDYFTQQEIQRADRYRGPRDLLAFSTIGINLIVLGILGLGRGARRLGSWAASRTTSWWRQTLLLSAILVGVPFVVAWPLHIAAWDHARDFGLATNSFAAATADDVKGLGFAFVSSAIAALAFIGVARRFPRRWPVAVGSAIGLLTIALVFLFPLVYEPAFNRFTPVDAATRARIISLADKEGVDVSDVLVADASRRTAAKNAYVSGLGASRRVVLYDTLLRGIPAGEVDAVVAHELAHVKHNDVLKGTLLGVAGGFLGVGAIWLFARNARFMAWAGASGPGDPRILPFVALFIAVATLVTAPIVNAQSRRMEAAADRTALETTGDVDTAIKLEVTLARTNLADLTPNSFVRWAFHTHPTTLERIQAALDYGAARS